jgi:hypothetical protein
MKRDRVSGDKLFKGAMNQIKIMRNADAKSVSTTSSRRSRARAKLEAILAKVKLAEEEAALYKRPMLDQLYSCKRLYTLHIVPCLSL